jgi:hypothetical protein
MSRACGETIGPRIRTCRFVDASARCNGSNRPDQRNGSCPFMPQFRTCSTSNAISFPAIRSALSEAKRFRIGGRQLRPEQEPSPSPLVWPEPRDNPPPGVLERIAPALRLQDPVGERRGAKEKKVLVIDDEEACIVGEIFALASDHSPRPTERLRVQIPSRTVAAACP